MMTLEWVVRIVFFALLMTAALYAGRATSREWYANKRGDAVLSGVTSLLWLAVACLVLFGH